MKFLTDRTDLSLELSICLFCLCEFTFLGYCVTPSCIHPDADKVRERSERCCLCEMTSPCLLLPDLVPAALSPTSVLRAFSAFQLPKFTEHVSNERGKGLFRFLKVDHYTSHKTLLIVGGQEAHKQYSSQNSDQATT